jgi:hypothetical protein
MLTGLDGVDLVRASDVDGEFADLSDRQLLELMGGVKEFWKSTQAETVALERDKLYNRNEWIVRQMAEIVNDRSKKDGTRVNAAKIIQKSTEQQMQLAGVTKDDTPMPAPTTTVDNRQVIQIENLNVDQRDLLLEMLKLRKKLTIKGLEKHVNTNDS